MTRRPRILVVDDDAEVGAVLREMLELAGFSVATAGSGLSALVRIGVERPDLIVLDLKLQDISGFDVYRALRQEPEFQRLPVLFISGAYHDEDWIRGQAGTGPFEYLPKPVDLDVLLMAIDGLGVRAEA